LPIVEVRLICGERGERFVPLGFERLLLGLPLVKRFAQRVAISTERVFHHPSFDWLEQFIRGGAGGEPRALP
jgi:hypothetical protein